MMVPSDQDEEKQQCGAILPQNTNNTVEILTGMQKRSLSNSHALPSGPILSLEEDKHAQPLSLKKQLKNENLPIDVPVGSIIAFAGDKEPEGWLMCDGSSYSSQKYPKLYEIIKEKYVLSNSWIIEANKISTEKFFHVPDLRGRVLVGVDNAANRVTSNNKLGESGGEENVTLKINQLPSHTHEIQCSPQTQLGGPYPADIILPDVRKNVTIPKNTGSSGENQPHNNMQPYLVSNYIIKAEKDEKYQIQYK